jgi:threonyl-tRNA synthetase
MEAGEIAVRTRKGKDLGKYKIDEFVSLLENEVRTRTLNILED